MFPVGIRIEVCSYHMLIALSDTSLSLSHVRDYTSLARGWPSLALVKGRPTRLVRLACSENQGAGHVSI